MKKLFLIPLLALFSCVNMWADVSTWAELTAALDGAVTVGGTITLSGDIDANGGSYVYSSSAISTTINLNGKELKNCTITNASTAPITIQYGTLTNCSVGGKVTLKTLSVNGQFLKGNITIVRANNVATNVTIQGGNSSTKVEANIIVDGTTTTDDKVTFYNAFFNGNVTIKSGASARIETKAGANTGDITNNGNSVIEFKNNAFTSANKTITMNAGGSLKLYSTSTSAIVFGESSTATLIGAGTFTGSATFYAGNNATLQMSGSTFKPSTTIDTNNRPAHFNLTGGKTNFDPSDYLAAGYYAVKTEGVDEWTISTNPNPVLVIRNKSQNNQEYASFAAAYNNINNGDELELLANCLITANSTYEKAFTTTGDYNLSVNDGVTVTFNNANTNIAKLGAYSGANVTLTAGTYALSGFEGNLTINGATVSKESAISLSKALVINSGELNANVNLAASTAAMTMSNGTLNGNITTSSDYNTLNITGGTINGAINITHYGTNLAIGGVTVVSENGPALRSMATNNLTITSGSYTNNGEGEVVEGGNGSYKLTLQGGTYNKEPNAAYIPEGYEAVQSGDNWVVQAAAAEFVSVSKNGGAAQSFSNMSDFIAYLPLSNDGSNYTITLLRDYSMNLGDGLEIYSNNSCTLDLNGHQLTASSNDNKSKLLVGGELILNANGGSIVIPNDNGISVLNGGKATINGGTYTTSEYNSTAFYADAEGKLTINDATINATVGCAIRSKGNAIVKNTTITSACNAMYAVINAGNMSLISTNVTGNHGAVACIEEAGTLDIDGGVFRAENQELFDAYAALYVATSSMVSAKGVKFYSDRENYAVLSGDNDSGKTFGIVNLYNNCYLSDKMHVSERKVSTAEVAFPVQLAESSAWYSSFGGEGPLPAGYEYRAIINEGEPTAEQVLDAEAYSEGYRWKVVSTAAKQEEASGTTIPWQQNTTWTDTETPSVPDENTAVVIPEGKTVVVSNSVGDNTAEANQVNIASNGSLTVQENTSLTITNGINIANGGSLNVNEGGTVIVGAGGIISSDETTIVLTSSEDSHSTLLLDPDVKENTQPKATYKFKSKGRKIADGKYIWQRLGIPTFDGGTMISWDQDVQTALYDFDYTADDWHLIYAGPNDIVINPGDGKPFQCYAMTIDQNPVEDVVYTFTGNLMGNTNAKLNFVSGWNYYANSYTAPIDIYQFMDSIRLYYKERDEKVSATVYVYNRSNDWWDGVNLVTVITDPNAPKKINPMQAFILELVEGESATNEIDYKKQIYDPIINAKSSPVPQAERASDFNTVLITVTNGELNDKLTLFEQDGLSDEFDNGYDATKFTENTEFNLYCQLGDKKLGTLATNDLSNKFIAFDAKAAGEYIMSFSNAIGDEISLYDAVADSTIVMKSGESYKFTAQAINDAERFIINKKDAPSAIEDVKNVVNATKYIGIDGQLYIRRAGKVYNVQGKEVK